MSKFKTMKIKVNDTNRELVRQALVAAGYEPQGTMLVQEIYKEADGFYTYGADYVLCSTGSVEGYFEQHKNPEYWLVNGEFVDVSYWTQPATANIPDRYKNPATAEDKAAKDACNGIMGDWKQPLLFEPFSALPEIPPMEAAMKKVKEYYDLRFAGPAETTYEPLPDEWKRAIEDFEDGLESMIYQPALPLGITPRADFLRSRNVEILQAMLRYTEANMTIPSAWFLELEDNNEELSRVQ